jgi:hypothetical protein
VSLTSSSLTPLWVTMGGSSSRAVKSRGARVGCLTAERGLQAQTQQPGYISSWVFAWQGSSLLVYSSWVAGRSQLSKAKARTDCCVSHPVCLHPAPHRYVQCYDCGNPETVVKIKKEFIYLKCKACG